MASWFPEFGREVLLVRIQFSTEGGLAYLPGLARRSLIDCATLPAGEAEELERAVSTAKFFELPAEVGSQTRGAADLQSHTITVEADDRTHTVRVREPVTDDGLRLLLDRLRRKSRRRKGS